MADAANEKIAKSLAMMYASEFVGGVFEALSEGLRGGREEVIVETSE